MSTTGEVQRAPSAAIGAGPHERTASRSNQRNGGRARTISTPAGDVDLRIPKLRVGSFVPSLLEPRRRVDKALWAVIMTAYITGTSTRKVDDLVRVLGNGPTESAANVKVKDIRPAARGFRNFANYQARMPRPDHQLSNSGQCP